MSDEAPEVDEIDLLIEILAAIDPLLETLSQLALSAKTRNFLLGCLVAISFGWTVFGLMLLARVAISLDLIEFVLKLK